MSRTNLFTGDRNNGTRVNGEAVLRWLAAEAGQESRQTNRRIAAAIELTLDNGRTRSRRLSEALEALRTAGLIEMLYEPPHPRESPTGRVIQLTEKGAQLVAANV